MIDDAAVTPGYAVGLPPERGLRIVAKIALGSLRNTLIFILSASVLVSASSIEVFQTNISMGRKN